MRTGQQQGFALVLVLWLVAGLTLIAMALTSGARSEIRAVELRAKSMEAAAIADAAINVALLQWYGSSGSLGVPVVLNVFEKEVAVTVTSANGLVNLNYASRELLSRLFESGAGLNAAAATRLADEIVAWRTPGAGERNGYGGQASPDAALRGGRLEFDEDLLQVGGVALDVFEHVRPYITVYGASPVVSADAAPADLVEILSRGATGTASHADLRSDFFGEFGSSAVRVDARVSLDGYSIVRRRWVDFGYPSSDGIPWRTLRVETLYP